MQTLLLVAFAFLLRATCAGELKAAGGFYLGQEPASVGQACSIMFNCKNFHQLPSLSVVAPLSLEDGVLLLKGTANQMHRIANPEHGIWGEWMEVLQLSEEDPSLQQCKSLHQLLLDAARLHEGWFEFRMTNAHGAASEYLEEGLLLDVIAYSRRFLSHGPFQILIMLMFFMAITSRSTV